MINNLGLFNSLFNTSSQVTSTSNSKVDTIIEEHKNKKTEAEEIKQTTDTNLYLSSKSQKINALSNEFFNKKDLNFLDIEQLKERAYQFGLISKSEYSALSNAEVTNTNNELSNKTTTVSLSGFIDDFLKRLDVVNEEFEESDTQEDNESVAHETLLALKTSLQTAKDILINVDEAKNKDSFKTSLNESLAFIKETINTDAFDKMKLDDKVGISKVYQALEIVNSITPQRLSNAKINRYIDLSD